MKPHYVFKQWMLVVDPHTFDTRYVRAYSCGEMYKHPSGVMLEKLIQMVKQ